MSQVRDNEKKRVYIVAEARLPAIPGAVPKKGKGKDDKPTGGFELLGKMTGKDLVGKKYKPLFPYFANLSTAFKVVADGYVTDDSGTGVVHQVRAGGYEGWVWWLRDGGCEEPVEGGVVDTCGGVRVMAAVGRRS